MPQQSRSASIAPLLAVNFVGTLGLSIVTPFLVVLVVQWGGNSVVFGILSATYSFFQFFGASILGRLSDRVGRRRVLLVSQFGTMVSWGVFLIAFAMPGAVLLTIEHRWVGDFVLTLPLLVLFFARAADGLTGGNVSVANAYLADVTTESDRSKSFGKMAISGNLGYIVGPALAGILGATVFGEIIPVLAAFLVSTVALFLIRFGLEERTPVKITGKIEHHSACEVYGHDHVEAYRMKGARSDGLRTILALPNLHALMAVNFLVMFGFNIFYVVFPVHALSGLDWNVTQIGIFFAVVSLIMVVAQGPVLTRAAKVWGERGLMWGGGGILAIGFALLSLPSTESVYFAGTLVGVGNGIMWPTFMSVLSKSSSPDLQGAVQGYTQSIGAIASILGLLIGGLAYVTIGAGLFHVAGILVAISAIFAATYRPSGKKTTET